jgi:D-tyrosyl-tRNA(Tyr) deacylase
MEVVLIPKDDFESLVSKVDLVTKHITKYFLKSGEVLMDNEEFIRLMKVSKRTAQTWRDKKFISYSQVGSKVYYLRSDVDIFISRYRIEAGIPILRD